MRTAHKVLLYAAMIGIVGVAYADETPTKTEPVAKTAPAKAPAKAAPKAPAKAAAKAPAKAPAKAETKAPAKAETKAPAKGEIKVDGEVKVTDEAKKEAKEEAKAETKADAKKGEDAKPTPPETPGEAFSLIKQIINAVKTGKWALLVGLVVMLLTFIVNKLIKEKIPRNVLPWLAIGLGVIGNTAFALSTGVPWMDAILGGVNHGLVAAGGWSAIGKYLPFMGKKKEPDPAPAPEGDGD
jgi:hypothetical protein